MPYLTIAEADAYWQARQNAAWSGLEDEAAKTAAITKAVQYIDANYEFVGELTSPEQANAWPRQGIFIETGNFAGKPIGNDEIPQVVKDATAELAVYSLTGELQDALVRGGQVRFEKVGDISHSFFAGAPSGRQFPNVDAILQPVLTSTGLRRT